MSDSPMIRTLPALALAAALALLLPAQPADAACDCTVLPSLGAAANYPAFGLDGTDVTLTGNTFNTGVYPGPAAAGDLGVGSGGSIFLDGNASAVGAIYHHTGTSVTGGSGAAGGVIEQDMSAAVADAIAASAAFAALTPTQTFSGLTTTTTITGNGCINVIQVDGDIHPNGNRRITFKGGADDYFVVNIAGEIKMTGGTGLLLDGIEPRQLIFNITTPGKGVSFGGTNTRNGTFLNVAGDVQAGGSTGGTGAYISGGASLAFSGGAAYQGESFHCGVPVCADPEASGVNIQTPATPAGRSTGNTPFYHAYYDTSTYEGHLEAFKVAPDGTLTDNASPTPLDAIDPVTKLLKATRTPYWDAGVLLRTDTVRTLYTTDPVTGLRGVFGKANANLDTAELDLTAGEIPSYPNYPASRVDTLPELRDAVIDYVHGKDTFDEDADLVFTEMRSAVLGDIFHSNALFVGSPSTVLAHEDGYEDFLTANGQRDRVVYAGANGAVLHGFDAGAFWDPDDPNAFNTGTGAELFGYVPGLLLPLLKQTPKTIDVNGNRLAPGFVDGSTMAADAWLGDGTGTDITKVGDEWATVLVSAYREGGRGYMALDVTNPAAAAAPHGPYPKLLWEFTEAKMGQSWSRPVVTRVKIQAGSAGDHCGADDGDGNCVERWVAIFGAGHEPDGDPNDSNYLVDPTSAGWSNRGKALFMLDLHTGAILAQAAFDGSVGSTTATMKYGLPSAPAVLDLDGKGFADVVYIGDTAGQLWKWDISAVGIDGADADTLIDNYPIGVFFKTDPVVVAGGASHYRSIYAPAAASYANGVLTLAFGTGERRDTLYLGDPSADDNNRFYVIQDHTPTGFTTPLVPLTEAAISATTSDAVDTDPTDRGYYIVAEDGEKFFNEVIIFADHVIAVSYLAPDPYPTCGSGEAFLYAFELSSGKGFFDFNATPEAGDRRLSIGTGIPSSPRVTVSSDPAYDKIFVTTSDGQVLIIDPPLRDGPENSTIYWRQIF